MRRRAESTAMTDTVRRVLNIVNEKGLHARASAKLVEVVEDHDAQATVRAQSARTATAATATTTQMPRTVRTRRRRHDSWQGRKRWKRHCCRHRWSWRGRHCA